MKFTFNIKKKQSYMFLLLFKFIFVYLLGIDYLNLKCV